MTDMVDFGEGGFLEAAEIDVAKIADDPFNFGQAYWPLKVTEFRAPKVSDTGKFGSYVVFKIQHERFVNLREFGQWLQIPTPKAIQAETGVFFDPDNNPDDMQVAFRFKKFLFALGHDYDKMAKVGPAGIQDHLFATRLRAVEENGFFKPTFNFAGTRRLSDDASDATDQFVSNNQQSSNGNGMDAIKAALEAESNG